jgi:hypothetical protein
MNLEPNPARAAIGIPPQPGEPVRAKHVTIGEGSTPLLVRVTLTAEDGTTLFAVVRGNALVGSAYSAAPGETSWPAWRTPRPGTRVSQ